MCSVTMTQCFCWPWNKPLLLNRTTYLRNIANWSSGDLYASKPITRATAKWRNTSDISQSLIGGWGCLLSWQIPLKIIPFIRDSKDTKPQTLTIHQPFSRLCFQKPVASKVFEVNQCWLSGGISWRFDDTIHNNLTRILGRFAFPFQQKTNQVPEICLTSYCCWLEEIPS